MKRVGRLCHQNHSIEYQYKVLISLLPASVIFYSIYTVVLKPPLVQSWWSCPCSSIDSFLLIPPHCPVSLQKSVSEWDMAVFVMLLLQKQYMAYIWHHTKTISIAVPHNKRPGARHTPLLSEAAFELILIFLCGGALCLSRAITRLTSTAPAARSFSCMRLRLRRLLDIAERPPGHSTVHHRGKLWLQSHF